MNLKNLEFLEELQLIGNQLETIDLSDNQSLKILRLGENYFSSFDLESTPRVNSVSYTHLTLPTICSV